MNKSKQKLHIDLASPDCSSKEVRKTLDTLYYKILALQKRGLNPKQALQFIIAGQLHNSPGEN